MKKHIISSSFYQRVFFNVLTEKLWLWCQSVWGYTFLKTPPVIFRFVILPLEILLKKNFHPWTFSKIAWHLLEIPWSKTKTYGNSTWVFLEHPWKFPLFSIYLWNFHMLFLQYHWKFHVLNVLNVVNNLGLMLAL